MKEFTEFDKELARHIYGRYKWIARDVVGDLHLFISKPSKEPRMWDCQHGDMNTTRMPIYGAFESIQWSDNEPTLIRSIYDPHILDDTEKEYLKTVLKPFRNKIRYVTKANNGINVEFIAVELKDEIHLFAFPDFIQDTMYVGMKQGHPYTLRELGITYD